ncbi:MAG: hypothetical protein NWF11_06510 [Candidatus Bathyarchaeota archaeon]|nr:hypothetical protein [Candidatus Bathyarchaeota archaeon]
MTSTKEIMEMALNLSDFKHIPADSAIYFHGKNIRRVLFGIDADVPELLIAKQYDYDAVISHHPKGGSAIIDFHKVFKRHIHQMVEAGVPKHEAEIATRNKMKAIEVEMHTKNYGHAVDVARILEMPYMNIHTPLDELGRRIMSQKIAKAKEYATVKDIVSLLYQLPEFAKSETKIQIHIGDPANTAGNTIVSHGAGTNGGYEIAKTYFKYGVDTLIYIHVSPGDLEKLKADGSGNLIISGHIASDSVGINPLITELENNGILVSRIGIIPP